MGSKIYKGKLCVYCLTRQSVCGDHIFSRKFFLPPRRDSLPQVPSCDPCNNEKSKLEHYLTTLLPFGGRHSDAKENLETTVSNRLAKNARLHNHLKKNQGRVISLENGTYKHTMSLPFESEKLILLFTYVTRGLVWYHWKTILTDEHEIRVLLLSDRGDQLFDQFFRVNAAQRLTADLGNGTFFYEGAPSIDPEQLTLLRFRIYSGLVLAGDPNTPAARPTMIGSLIGPADLINRFLNSIPT